MRFILRGEELEIDPKDVKAAVRTSSPEVIRKHYVEVDGKRFPLKQVLEEVLKKREYKNNAFSRLDFTTLDARSILQRLGFTCGEV